MSGELFHVHPNGRECVPDDRGNWWWKDGPAVICDDPNNSGCMSRDVLREDDWADERADVLARFQQELAKATGDGSKKRQAGSKPPWYEDDSHEAAIFSHLTKWKRGELVDPDSGAHPLVHAGWRCLAIACRESGNIPTS